jgi:hypothetical protein
MNLIYTQQQQADKIDPKVHYTMYSAYKLQAILLDISCSITAFGFVSKY